MRCVVDHIVYNCASLEHGVAFVERLTGVRAAYGGAHPNRGTHNALLSFGDDSYLEIIAPDPDQPGITPQAFRLYDAQTHDKLSAFAVRPQEGDIEEHRAALGAGPVGDKQRQKPDGTLLAWRMTPGPGAPGSTAGGAEPWIIDWGETEHPATASPSGCALVALEVADPRAASLGPVLEEMGLTTPVELSVADSPSIVAVIETPKGTRVRL